MLVHNAQRYPHPIGSAAALRLKSGTELIDQSTNSVEARQIARRLSGLGDDSIPLISDVGPQSGWVVGRQSLDGKRGWRMDWDPNKGYHVNWWDKTQGKRRKDYLYGAVEIEGGTWDDYIELLQHGFGNRY